MNKCEAFSKKIMKIVTLIALITSGSAFDHIQTKTHPLTQANAVFELIQRLIPERARDFVVEVDPNLQQNGKELFKIESLPDNRVKVSGTTGVVVATGFNYYLKYYLHCHVAWEFSQLELPEILPKVNYTNVMNDKFRYYQNVCTTSYSFVWWTWADWEKHIDWMAMNSFNLVLAFNGQEAIWKRVYEKLNLTQNEIDEQFTGPAFLSWERMGNIRGWGGPLSDSWHRKSLTLQKKILQRMRDLGIIPILPAFTGYVPKALKRIYPDVNLTSMTWNNFNETFQPYLLDPFDSHFQIIGDMFMEEMIEEFGTDHVYSSDTFNEVMPPSTDLDYVKKAGEAVYTAMTGKDPKAIWVMQNWLFVHSFIYWTPSRAKALLTSVPLGKMIVLDLQSEQFPQYDRFESYYGQPYIWCMLHNFGGTLGMFGSTDIINKRLFDARSKKGSTMIGTGLTPEGIFQNYVIYELMSEMAFRREPVNLQLWFKEFATRRYGQFEANAFQAWSILMTTVYNFPGAQRIRGKYTMNVSPTTRISVKYWYSPCDVYRAWNHLLQAADSLKYNYGYQHDLVDLTRQVIQLIGDDMYKEAIFVYKQRDVKSFNRISEGRVNCNLPESSASYEDHDSFSNSIVTFLSLFDDLESILATSKEFLLGVWLNSAKNSSDNDKDRRLFEYNARNQITLWGPNGEIKDYATKQWAGIVKDFFKVRWAYFLQKMLEALENKKPFDQATVKSAIFENIEKPFTFETNEYSEEAIGDTVEVANDIYKRWWPKINCDNL